MKNKTKNTALCGFAAALSVVLMLFTTIVPVFMYVLPIISGLLVLFVSEIVSKKWAVGVYFSTAVLSLLLLTDKEAGLTYTMFFGYYPLIKGGMEKLNKVFAWLVKLLLFNSAAVAIGWLGVVLFGLSGEEYNELGVLTIPLLLAMANVVFVLYDIMLTRYGFLIPRIADRVAKLIK